jgi:hypothetical protein
LDEVHFRYGLLVQTMPRLRLRPRGFIPDIAFGREPSHSTGGTFTRVDARFPSAHPKTEVAAECLRMRMRKPLAFRNFQKTLPALSAPSREPQESLRSLVRQAKPGISTELKREQHDKIVSIMKPTWR